MITITYGYGEDHGVVELPDKPSPQEFKDAMQKLHDCIYDTEEVHVAMDTLLCKTLESLGYAEGIKIFDDTYMWYA